MSDVVQRRCPACSAPLPAASPGDHLTCEHCGASVTIRSGSGATLDAPAASTPSQGGGRWILIVVVAVILISLVTAAVPIVLTVGVAGVAAVAAIEQTDAARSSAESALQGAMGDQLSEAMRRKAEADRREAGFALAELPDVQVDGWFAVHHAPTSPLDAFDPLAEIGWATEVARAWSPDAVLTGIDVDHVPVSGQLDLPADEDAEVAYRFFSAARHKAAEALQEVSEEELPNTLRFRITGDEGVRLLLASYDPPGSFGGGRRIVPVEPLPASLCSLQEAIAAAREAPEAKKRPFYDLRLTTTMVRDLAALWQWRVDAETASSEQVWPDSCTLIDRKAATARATRVAAGG